MFGELTRDEVFRIETRRLWLRWPCMPDAAAITAVVSRFEVADKTDRIPHPYPAGEAERFVERARRANAEGDGLTLAITEKSGHRTAVGLIDLHRFGSADDRALSVPVLGYVLSPERWGCGYMTEAAAAMVEAGFRLAETPRIESAAHRGNPASARVLEKCGFVHSGVVRRHTPMRDRVVELDTFSLSRSAWRHRQPSLAFAESAACDA
jgi:RimJ/RimL family protein N-acetyltransferase